jgi:hypothetical protein
MTTETSHLTQYQTLKIPEIGVTIGPIIIKENIVSFLKGILFVLFVGPRPGRRLHNGQFEVITRPPQSHLIF